MAAKLRLVFSFSILFLSFYGFAQQKYWTPTSANGRQAKKLVSRLQVKGGRYFSLDRQAFRSELDILTKDTSGSTILYFPDEAGKLVAFRVSEHSIMAPELAQKYPEVRSYRGYSLTNKADRIRFSISHKGLQGMTTYADERAPTFIQKSGDDRYLAYARDSYSRADIDFVCDTKAKVHRNERASALRPVDGQVLREYRLAVSATGEYTEYHGGSVSDALAAINATVTRINALFETDLAVRLVLVGNTDSVIYTDPDTDPYTGNLNNQAQSTLTREIGEANYDIGHLFNNDQNNGNAGFIGAICEDGSKGSAFSSGTTPEGDIFDLDFVAHEIGHQLGANHTWSFESEGTQVQAEPGSGTTIMGYAGITGSDNVALNSDDYFHYNSIVQIIENLETKSCGQSIPLTNTPPVIAPLSDYTIPKGTAFVLTGEATDADAGDVLTYTWEQIDDGVVTQGTFGPLNPSGANFRSLPPSTDPTRYFPNLSRVLAGQLTETTPNFNDDWETVSEVEREMNFALTVRDNATGGGQVGTALSAIQVINGAGPFLVTSQESSDAVTAGDVMTVTWDVANTDTAPVNVSSVDLLLSTDGGTTFLPLAEGVPNDGSHEVVVPGLPTTAARIMVKAQGNIFYAVNAVDFEIVSAPVVLAFETLSYEVCQGDDLSFVFDYQTFDGFSAESTFSATVPAGANVVFSPATATANNTEVTVTVSNTNNVAVGAYEIVVSGTATGNVKEVPLALGVFDDGFEAVTLQSPADGAEEVTSVQELQWEGNGGYTAYDIEIATDVAFANITETATVTDNAYLPLALENDQQYFWRVRPKNVCGEGAFGTAFGFRTIPFNCITKASRDGELQISSTGTPTITSTISFFENLPVADIDVILDVDHTFLSDLVITLTSPSGTSVTMVSNSCGDLKNIDAIFDNDAEPFQCDGTPAISGRVRPLGGLGSFNGESIFGDWVLTVTDTAPADGGFLRSFSMDVCVEGEFSPDADNDGIFDDDDLCPDTPDGQEVDVTGCPVFRLGNDSLQISVISETCRANNDGEIIIVPDTELDYSVSVEGNGVSIADTFTTVFRAGSLDAGTYTVCVLAADGDITYEEACSEVVVTEPEALSVSATLAMDNSAVILNFEGADSYEVSLNGVVRVVTEETIRLDLQKGVNTVKVNTGLSCQGSYEERFYLFDGLAVYPNPFVDRVTVNVADAGIFTMEVYSLNGKLVLSDSKTIPGTEAVLDVSGLASGTYFLKVFGESQNETVKLIKQ
ncbi:reprolysin-like metallopeptidase [Maribacter sp. 2-571]|uniref:zinc-dependent metalloprotease n=1 Tax=Maribacter sp. 2-571 TaxID=3417569 RepID=UPI003D339D75